MIGRIAIHDRMPTNDVGCEMDLLIMMALHQVEESLFRL